MGMEGRRKRPGSLSGRRGDSTLLWLLSGTVACPDEILGHLALSYAGCARLIGAGQPRVDVGALMGMSHIWRSDPAKSTFVSAG